MTTKSCLMCKHFGTDPSTPDYSDETGGDMYKIWCAKHHFILTEPTEEDFREIAPKAETCGDFQP